jgi:cob(I)alamin adenosyltransferase
MKIYTKTGDAGQTSLLFGARVSKDDARVDAYGTTDEANSAIGLALSLLPADPPLPEMRAPLAQVQQGLFAIGAELATPPGRRPGWEATESQITDLERAIDALEERMPPLTSFLLPGGSPAGSALHLARTVVRRAERAAVAIARESDLNPLVVTYLNRLSDFLFVCARYVNHQLGSPEAPGPVPQGLRGAARQAELRNDQAP